ncbi:hypothetical protein [Methanobrevibacter sp. DSM 116169]|uniref:hypothetical protein n=1 Tax=Methanobrevibacter sp. DSM 116169 TaxID=3242727 RepID=UPI0038FC3D33
MPEYGEEDLVFKYDGIKFTIDDVLNSITFPNLHFNSQFPKNVFVANYNIVLSYWQYISLMYDIINPEDVKKFISEHEDDLKSLISNIPFFVKKEFPNDIISLELIKDPDVDKKLLRAYIHTSVSPTEAIEKLDIIDDLSSEIETIDTLDSFLLNVEFE